MQEERASLGARVTRTLETAKTVNVLARAGSKPTDKQQPARRQEHKPADQAKKHPENKPARKQVQHQAKKPEAQIEPAAAVPQDFQPEPVRPRKIEKRIQITPKAPRLR